MKTYNVKQLAKDSVYLIVLLSIGFVSIGCSTSRPSLPLPYTEAWYNDGRPEFIDNYEVDESEMENYYRMLKQMKKGAK